MSAEPDKNAKAGVMIPRTKHLFILELSSWSSTYSAREEGRYENKVAAGDSIK